MCLQESASNRVESEYYIFRKKEVNSVYHQFVLLLANQYLAPR